MYLQKLISRILFSVGDVKVNDENSRIWIHWSEARTDQRIQDPDPYQNATLICNTGFLGFLITFIQ
jgi:hypothetical protein